MHLKLLGPVVDCSTCAEVKSNAAFELTTVDPGMVKIMMFSKKIEKKIEKNHDFFSIYISDIYRKPIKVNYYVKYCYIQCVNTT